MSGYGDVVASGSVEVYYEVVEFEHNDGTIMYDVQLENGDEADELFETIEEAEEWVRMKLS